MIGDGANELRHHKFREDRMGHTRYVVANRIISFQISILGEPEVTASIYCKSCNLPNTETQRTVQICGNFWVTQYIF